MGILVDHAVAVNIARQGAQVVENRPVFLTDGAFGCRELPVGGVVLSGVPGVALPGRGWRECSLWPERACVPAGGHS